MNDDGHFSHSMVWDLQKQYYQQIDIKNSWGKNDIPFQATSNPFIAEKYAEFIAAWIKQTNPQKPITLLEIGVGHGRFSFLLLKHLQELLEKSSYSWTNSFSNPGSNQAPNPGHKYSNTDAPPASDSAIKYIMTDVSENNFEYWMAHPKLLPFQQMKLLDFALFDVTNSGNKSNLRDTVLKIAGTSLTTRLKNSSVILISNYMLCALPYDLFKINQGQLETCRIAPYHRHEEPSEYSDPKAILKDLRFKFSYQPTPESFYSDPLLDKTLMEYPQILSQGTFTVPIYIIELFNDLYRINPDFIWLLTDEAVITTEQLEQSQAVVGRIENGTLSNRVNLHVLNRYIKNFSKQVYAPANPDKKTDTYCIFSHSDQAAQQHKEILIGHNFRAKSYFQLVHSLHQSSTPLDIDGLLALFELGSYDPDLVPLYFDQLMAVSQDLKGHRNQHLSQVLQQCWNNYYDIGESFKMAFSIGRLLRRLKRPEMALPVLQQAIDRDPEYYRGWYLLGRCYQALDSKTDAIACYERVLKLKPTHQYAQQRKTALTRSKAYS